MINLSDVYYRLSSWLPWCMGCTPQTTDRQAADV